MSDGTRTALPLIELKGVGKEYTKYDDAPMLLTKVLRFRPGRTKRSKLWALRGVDLEVQAGETVGVIGRNGSGKSTMLRMLAGVTAPTEGAVIARGRVAPLIAVGVGFHPELTGRENVHVNGTILGMPRQEIERRFDEIVAFADIEQFIDTPVKFYSSGMFVRLGFSVAVAAEPDILLIDEVLAVGDFAFQAKCFERMSELRASGATVLVVSHNLNAVRSMCDRTLLLHDGSPVYCGDTDEALSQFHGLLDDRSPEDDEGSVVTNVGIELLDPDGSPTNHFSHGEELTCRITATAARDIEAPKFFVMLERLGSVIYADSDFLSGSSGPAARGDQLSCDVRLVARFPTGTYSLTGGVIWGDGDRERRPSRAADFYVSGRHYVRGLADLEASFTPGGLAPPDSEGQGGGAFHGA